MKDLLNDCKWPSKASDPLRAIASASALLLICVPLMIGAIWAFPIWDDAWLWLLLKEHGAEVIAASFADRPLNAALWALLATSEHAFWHAAFIAQALLWPTFGLISALLWSHLFPHHRRYALVVACLTVAPFATKVQMVTANIALASLLSVVLGYGALLLLLRFVKADDNRGRVAFALSLPTLVVAILLQEYALSVVIVMLILFLTHARNASDPATRIRAIYAIFIAIFLAGAAYTAYLLAADYGIRPDVSPGYILTLGKSHLLRLPFEVVSAIWQGIVGGFAASLGQVTWTSKAGVAGIAYGALVGILLAYGSQNRLQHRPSSKNLTDQQGALALALALVAGLIPIVAMGRLPWDPSDGISSRFGLPVLPIAAAIMVLMGIGLVQRRFWAVPIILLGFVAGHAAFTEAWSAVQEQRKMSALGEALQPYVSSSDGYTVAVVALPERTLGPRRQWELTARLSATWPAELRRKFWAYRFGGGPPLGYWEEAREIFGTRGSCKRPQDIDITIRLVARRGRLDRLLWVEPQPDGAISVEPYCIGAS